LAEDPKVIMSKSDDDLRFWTLAGSDGGYTHQMGQTEMNMRCAIRIAKAAADMASANRDLVDATRLLSDTTKQVVEGHHGLTRETKSLVRATWGIVLITLVTQVALIISEFLRT
jgi:hypothetical protein